MALGVTPKRRRGRPPKEESTALALDRAMMEYREALAGLVKPSLDALKLLLTSPTSSEKVKEGVAKYLLEKAEALDVVYKKQDDENEENKPSSVSSVDDDEQMPLTTKIREY